MKKIRCTLLCLTLLSATCLLAGCRSRQDESSASFPAESTSAAGAAGTTGNSDGSQSTGDMAGGAGDTSYEYENGAGSMSTDEGASLPGTGMDGGVIDDLGDDISDAVDDLGDDMTNGSVGANGTNESAGR